VERLSPIKNEIRVFLFIVKNLDYPIYKFLIKKTSSNPSRPHMILLEMFFFMVSDG
jgi:hypothetical protein